MNSCIVKLAEQFIQAAVLNVTFDTDQKKPQCEK